MASVVQKGLDQIMNDYGFQPSQQYVERLKSMGKAGPYKPVYNTDEQDSMAVYSQADDKLKKAIEQQFKQKQKQTAASVSEITEFLGQVAQQVADTQRKLTAKEKLQQAQTFNQAFSNRQSILKQFFQDQRNQAILSGLAGASQDFKSRSLTLESKIGRLIQVLDRVKPVYRTLLIDSLTSEENRATLFEALKKAGVIRRPPQKGQTLFNLTSDGINATFVQILQSLLAGSWRGSDKKFQAFQHKYAPKQDRIASLVSTAQKLRTVTPDGRGLSAYLKDGPYLTAFPHWAAGQIKSSQKIQNKATQDQSILGGLKDKNSTFYNALRSVDPVGARWDEILGQWSGPLVDRFFSKASNRAGSLQKKMERSQAVLKTVPSPDQMDKMVPVFIKQLVQANDSLSKVGFGPISGSATDPGFYAGRWIDSATGRVRLLPSANERYINPGSLNQKLGYLQAKMLNHWNQLMSFYGQYNKLKFKNPDQYKTNSLSSIKSGLTVTTNAAAFNNFINSTIVNFNIASVQKRPMTPTMAILGRVGRPALNQIYKKQSKTISNKAEVDLGDLRVKFQDWAKAINSATDSLLQQAANAAGLPPQMFMKITNRLNTQRLRLTGYMARRMQGSLNKARKIIEIPQNATVNQIYNIQKTLTQSNQALGDDIKKSLAIGLAGTEASGLSKMGSQLVTKLQSGANTAAMQIVQNFRQKSKNGMLGDKTQQRYLSKIQKLPGQFSQYLQRVSDGRSFSTTNVPTYLKPFSSAFYNTGRQDMFSELNARSAALKKKRQQEDQEKKRNKKGN